MSSKGKSTLDKGKKFCPRNPQKLTDSELTQYLELSDEDENLGDISKSDLENYESDKSSDEEILFPSAQIRPSLSPAHCPSYRTDESTPHGPVLPIRHTTTSDSPIPSTSTADPLQILHL